MLSKICKTLKNNKAELEITAWADKICVQVCEGPSKYVRASESTQERVPVRLLCVGGPESLAHTVVDENSYKKQKFYFILFVLKFCDIS